MGQTEIRAPAAPRAPVRRIVRLAVRMAVAMLASGAQTTDTEYSIRGVMRSLGLPGAEVVVTFSTVSISFIAPGDAQATTAIQMVREWRPDFSRLAAMSALARGIRAGEVNLEGAEAELERVSRSSRPYAGFVAFVAPGVSAAAATILFGGTPADALATLAIGLAIQPVLGWITASDLPPFFQVGVGVSATALLVVLLVALGVPLQGSLVLTGGLLRFLPGNALVSGAVFGREAGLAEVVIPPRSPFIGERVFPGMSTEDGSLVVAAIQRRSENVGEQGVELAAGDALLLQGPWEALDARADDPGFLVVHEPQLIRRQAVPLGPGARRALAVAAGMVVLLALGIVPSAVAGLLAAGALIVSRVMTIEQAYRGINWTTVVLVGAMLPLSTAMTETGAAELVADALVGAVRDAGPHALLAGLFLVTMVFGQLISNMATALIVIPIAVAAATELGIDIRPVLMSVTVAAAAALLTPVATPVNLMIMGPAGYRFADYWKLGLAVMVVFFAVAVFLVPVFWPFA